MEKEYAPRQNFGWTTPWKPYDHDIPFILTDNARTLEQDDPRDLPASALTPFRHRLGRPEFRPGGAPGATGQLRHHIPSLS